MIRPLHDELFESITIIKITTEPTTEASLLHSTVSIETEKHICIYQILTNIHQIMCFNANHFYMDLTSLSFTERHLKDKFLLTHPNW